MHHHRHYLASHQSVIFQISLKKWPPGTTAAKTSGVVNVASLLIDAASATGDMKPTSTKEEWRRKGNNNRRNKDIIPFNLGRMKASMAAAKFLRDLFCDV